MGKEEPKKVKKHICAGLLAHVDAGKTTLAESILYLSGNIRTLGRVDHGSAYLDTFELERSRGITIFAKQAEVTLKDKVVTFLDTPGHVDLGGDGAYASSAGLCSACNQRRGWSAGTCSDSVASAKEI